MAFIQRAISFLMAAVSFFAAVVGLASTILQADQVVAFIAISLVSALISLCMGIITFRVFSFFRLRRFRRTEEAFHNLIRSNSNVARILSFSRFEADGSLQRLHEFLSSLLDSYRVLMAEKSGRDTRVAIKVFVTDPEKNAQFACTFSRDSESAEIMAGYDRRVLKKDHCRVENLTDLSTVFYENRPFVCNDLHKHRREQAPFWRRLSVQPTWRLPYVSTLVVPVHTHEDHAERPAIIGALVFDSKKKSVFGPNEIELASFLADQLGPHIWNASKWVRANKSH